MKQTHLIITAVTISIVLTPLFGQGDESHNSGQNCLNCHYDGGPANEHVFNIAGTIYTDPEGTEIQPGVNVYIEDANANLYLLVSSWAYGNVWFEEDEYEVECNDVPMDPCIELDQCNWEYDDEECEDAEGVPVQTPVPPFTATVEYNGYTATMSQLVQSGSCNSCHVAGMRIYVPMDENELENEEIAPIQYVLHQNHPNPFNPITTLEYDLPLDAFVTLTVFDLLGGEIAQLVNTTQRAGFKSIQWDATDSMGKPVSAGVYLYQIQAGEFVQTRKMVLLK